MFCSLQSLYQLVCDLAQNFSCVYSCHVKQSTLLLNKKISVCLLSKDPLCFFLCIWNHRELFLWCYSAATEANFKFQDTALWASPKGQVTKSLLEGKKIISSLLCWKQCAKLAYQVKPKLLLLQSSISEFLVANHQHQDHLGCMLTEQNRNPGLKPDSLHRMIIDSHTFHSALGRMWHQQWQQQPMTPAVRACTECPDVAQGESDAEPRKTSQSCVSYLGYKD